MRTAVLAVLLAAVLAFVGPGFIPSDPDLRVLFVGNSYTSTNDMPTMVETIGAANGVTIEAEWITPGGRTLREHALDPVVNDAVRDGEFDVVVLQEQSQTPARSEVFERDSIPAARRLAALAIEADTQIVLYQTWGHRNGDVWSRHGSYASMQAAIEQSYATMADAIGAEVAPVGTTWQRAMGIAPGVTLHSADGSHPTPAGSYLAALVITRTLTGEPVEVAPAGIVDETIAAALLPFGR